MNEAFEPVIVGFTCNWCSYRAADLAGTARVKGFVSIADRSPEPSPRKEEFSAYPDM